MGPGEAAHLDGEPRSRAVTGKPQYVKMVVYDYESDRVGSAMVKLK